jgi:hypothetical protein
MSESHQRQMQMFSENSGRYMDEFSTAFEQGMLELIARKARSQRVQANVLYRDYIADRNHTHMNATIWETLTDFVMYLGRTGKCEVDETEKGWFVTVRVAEEWKPFFFLCMPIAFPLAQLHTCPGGEAETPLLPRLGACQTPFPLAQLHTCPTFLCA